MGREHGVAAHDDDIHHNGCHAQHHILTRLWRFWQDELREERGKKHDAFRVGEIHKHRPFEAVWMKNQPGRSRTSSVINSMR